MPDYQFDLRNELMQYQESIKSFAIGDFSRMADVTRSILTRYLEDQEDSWAARGNFYRKLYEINASYYRRYQHEHASTGRKIKGIFGIYNTSEKEFLKLQGELKSHINLAEQMRKYAWHESAKQPPIITNLLTTYGVDPKRFRNRLNIHLLPSYRLRQYSHRLMKDKVFSHDEYEHFHGMPFELAAYKLRREIEKFITNYGKQVSYSQRSNLIRCISALNHFLQIQAWIERSVEFSKNNMVEKNKSDLFNWLEQNRNHQAWRLTRSIAKTMGVEVGDKSMSQTIDDVLDEQWDVNRAIENYFGQGREVIADSKPSSYGLFAQVATGTVIAAAAALVVYSRI